MQIQSRYTWAVGLQQDPCFCGIFPQVVPMRDGDAWLSVCTCCASVSVQPRCFLDFAVLCLTCLHLFFQSVVLPQKAHNKNNRVRFCVRKLN